MMSGFGYLQEVARRAVDINRAREFTVWLRFNDVGVIIDVRYNNSDKEVGLIKYVAWEKISSCKVNPLVLELDDMIEEVKLNHKYLSVDNFACLPKRGM